MSERGYGNLIARYRRYAPGYDQRFARYSAGSLSKSAQLVPKSAQSLLDIACGTGLFIDVLRRRRPDLRITGVDLSPEMLQQAQERFACDRLVDFIGGSAEFLPFEDNSFDVVACNNAFHLVQDASAALREFVRVLRPGGRVIIVDWCRDSPQMKAMALALRLTDRQVRQIRSLDALRAIVEEHGLRIDEASRFHVRPMWGLMAISAVKS